LVRRLKNQLKQAVEGIEVDDGDPVITVYTNRKLLPEEKASLDALMGCSDDWGPKLELVYRPPRQPTGPSREEVAEMVRKELGAFAGLLEGKIDAIVGMAVARGMTLADSDLPVLDETIVDVDTAGRVQLETVEGAEELVETTVVVEDSLADGAAALAALRKKKEGGGG
jgi:hypothetical protein